MITKIIPLHERTEAYEFIRAQVQSGRQVFVICPRIQPTQIIADGTQINADRRQYIRENLRNNLRESAALEIKSVTEEYEKLSKKVFPELAVAMLHGQLKAKDKQEIMSEFREGKTDILVSTSVIEVGVDVPNAAIMMIEGSERFGLAQLYQFRGRVGRAEHQSYCFLFTDSESASTRARLKAILEAKNGLELAEKDLKIRGPGEFLGEAQTGFPDSAMSGLQDAALVKASRDAAVALAARDPSLGAYPALRQQIKEFKERIHKE